MIFNVGGNDGGTAEKVKYNNSKSGLESDNVQGAVDELSDRLGGIKFGVDGNGNYGYIKEGADTVTPFKKSISTKKGSGYTGAPANYSGYPFNKTFNKTDVIFIMGLVCGWSSSTTCKIVTDGTLTNFYNNSSMFSSGQFNNGYVRCAFGMVKNATYVKVQVVTYGTDCSVNIQHFVANN